MSDFTKNLYEDLMALVQSDNAFSYKDFDLQGKKYRVFNYRLASWTAFKSAGALNCRGTMFEISSEPVLASLPPAKFFNYEEGNVNHHNARIGDQMVKMDGSLISTYMHNGQLLLKSKGALFSTESNAAMKWLDKPANSLAKLQLQHLVSRGYTINLEYTSPENRIVLPYEHEKLTIISVRDHADGRSLFASSLLNFLQDNQLTALKPHVVEFISGHKDNVSHEAFVNSIRQEQNGEGYVVEMILSPKQSYLVKIKNDRYVALHHARDEHGSTNRILEAVLEQGSDDLRGLFKADAHVLNKIEVIEARVQTVFNSMVQQVESFYLENKELDRKAYAVRATNELPNYISLAMSLYQGKEPNYKGFAKKNSNMFRLHELKELMEQDSAQDQPVKLAMK